MAFAIEKEDPMQRVNYPHENIEKKNKKTRKSVE